MGFDQGNKDSRGLVCWRAGTGKGLDEGVFFQVFGLLHILRPAAVSGGIHGSRVYLAL